MQYVTFVYCMQHAKQMRKDRYTVLDEIDLNKNKIKQVSRERSKESNQEVFIRKH